MTPKAVFASATLAITLAISAPAAAATLVLGGGMAESCFRVTLDGRSDAESLKTCSVALDTEALGRRDRAATLVNRGIIQLRRKSYQSANSDFDTAIRLQPSMAEAFVNRGAALIAQRRWRDGMADIDRGLALEPGEPEKAYFNRAIAWEALDNMEAAWRDYTRAQELKPDWDAPRKELARFTVTRQ